MKCHLGLAMGICLFFGSVHTGWSQGKPQQFYDAWKYHEVNKLWQCTYYFKTNPNEAKYQAHRVLYRPGDAWMYYRNLKKNVIWCRAMANPPAGRKNIWIVLADKDKREFLNQIPARAWERAASQPTIPGTGTGGPKMLPPPPVPK